MIQYSSVQKRLYNKWFTIDIFTLLAAICIFAIGQTAVADIKFKPAVNGTLSVHIHHLAWLLLTLSFRGIQSPYISLHKVVTVIIGMLPAVFVFMIYLLNVMITFMTVVISVVTKSFSLNILIDYTKEAPIFLLYYLWAAITWFLIFKYILRYYDKTSRPGDQSRLTTVTALLFFLGFLGAHRFYVKRIPSGLLYFATMGVFGFGIAIDAIMLIFNKFKDSEGNLIQ